ncbi:MAG TPA: flagellar basal body L-ring protein FlgH [Candidatus Acidoferrales bacterium]|jgi:flagellar L-ring protein precursor FlgH|nr:flagellar basal body L-ring protein FlgH [Candidatus Acidoferrales bacterium]
MPSFTRRLLAALLMLLATGASPKGTLAGHKFLKPKPGPADTSLEDYLSKVRAAGTEMPATNGSLWVSSGPMANLSSDYKARRPGDLIVVRLVDTFSAATSGENNTSRQFSTQSGITGLLGKFGPSNALQNMFNANSATALDGKGASTMSSNLQLNLSGRVVDMLPNGILVIEAVRDFTVGNDRQTVTVRGLVRPGDIATDNSVLSSQVTSVELAIKGKGAVADASRQPNAIVRLLLKVLSF